MFLFCPEISKKYVENTPLMGHLVPSRLTIRLAGATRGGAMYRASLRRGEAMAPTCPHGDDRLQLFRGRACPVSVDRAALAKLAARIAGPGDDCSVAQGGEAVPVARAPDSIQFLPVPSGARLRSRRRAA